MWVTVMTKHEKLLDKHQKKLSENHFTEGYLSDQEHVSNLIDWADFYRHNYHRFATDYLGLKLYEYQRMMLYELGNADTTICIAARASSKSFIIAIFACCEAILKPHSQIVIASSTLRQAKLIVSAKIQGELCPASPNLRREIKRVRSHGDEVEVIFRNGSSILVVVGNDNARGYRSTLLILEEGRMLKLNTINSVLLPFQHIRSIGFKDSPEYHDLAPEEAKTVLISSCWYRSHWLWTWVKNCAARVAAGDTRNALLAFDYVITLFHKIKTRRQLIADKKKMDPTTWLLEYCDVFAGDTESAWFDYDTLAKAQVNRQPPIYPRATLDSDPPRKGSCLPHQEGEVRVLSADMAFVDAKNHDNSAFSILRLLPEHLDNGDIVYRVQVAYIETARGGGGDTVKQARRLKQLCFDCDCDRMVIDARNAGIAVYDMLARPTYDETSGVEFPPLRCTNNEEVASRVKVEGALDVVFVVTATQKLNSDIAQLTRREFAAGHVTLLAPYEIAVDEILPHIKGYSESVNMDVTLAYEAPYMETQALINEMVNLTYEVLPSTGIIRVSETGVNVKDRYTSVSYGLWFADCLTRDQAALSGQYDYQCMSSVF
jgi:hypothetical protein